MNNNEEQTRLMDELNHKLGAFTDKMQQMHIAEYIQLLNNPKRLIWPSLIGGIFRGVGIVIGVTIVTSSLVYVLKLIGALNIPIVSQYIADIVEQVQRHLENTRF